jgi:hypothetical protein
MDFDLFDTTELLPMVESLFIPGNFLLKAFFPEVLEFDTRIVHFDRVLPDRRLAPFVSPLSPGKIQQPKGFQTESLIPAYIKPKNQVTAQEVMRRRAGEPLTGTMSPGDRRAAAILDYLFGHRQKIERRLEWMASSILRTGSVVISGDDYPAVTLDFNRDGGLTIALVTSSRWGESGVSPFDNVQTWVDDIATTSGAAANICVMDQLAWALFEADPKVQLALDRRFGQTASIELGLTPAVPGSPTYKGKIGALEFYVYNDRYEDDNGAIQKLIPDYTVMLGSQGGVEGAQMFGAILDPRNNYGAARYFAKNWIEDDPAGEFVMTQSAPVLAPRRVDATLAATVR